MTVAGYFLGSLIPADEVDKYLLPIVGLIIVLSVLPAVWHVIADKKEKKANAEKFASEAQT